MSSEPTISLDSLRGAGRDAGRCKVGVILDSLSPNNREVVTQALSGNEVEFPSGKIVSVLGSMRVNTTKDTVIKHRRGLCRCWRIQETTNA